MVQTILAKIKAALTGPLAIAIGMLLLVGIGGGVGYVVANMMIKAEEKKKAELKAAEEEAKRGPPKPQLVPLGDEGPNPFEPRYIELYSRYFRALTETDGAVLIHCTGGKDRTGLLAALTHHLLQVSPSDIMADYLLTNAAQDAEERVTVLMKKIAQGVGREPSRAGVRTAWLAEEGFLLAALESIKAVHGSTDNYLGAVLGVDADLRRRIASRLLA